MWYYFILTSELANAKAALELCGILAYYNFASCTTEGYVTVALGKKPSPKETALLLAFGHIEK